MLLTGCVGVRGLVECSCWIGIRGVDWLNWHSHCTRDATVGVDVWISSPFSEIKLPAPSSWGIFVGENKCLECLDSSFKILNTGTVPGPWDFPKNLEIPGLSRDSEVLDEEKYNPRKCRDSGSKVKVPVSRDCPRTLGLCQKPQDPGSLRP